MDFELTKEQKQIQKSVREFVKGEFKKDVILELEEKHEYPEKIWKKAAELGFIGIHFPEEYSGMGLGVIENILVAEELCRGDSSVGACLAAVERWAGLQDILPCTSLHDSLKAGRLHFYSASTPSTAFQ